MASRTVKQIFRRVPSVKQPLWGGAFWSSGFYIHTVLLPSGVMAAKKRSAAMCRSKYVQEQGTEKEYQRLRSQQMELF